MEINVLGKYRVEYQNKYSYRIDYDEFRDDITFWVKTMQGRELMNLISDLLKKGYLIKFETYVDFETKIEFEKFKPNTDEVSYITLRVSVYREGEIKQCM